MAQKSWAGQIQILGAKNMYQSITYKVHLWVLRSLNSWKDIANLNFSSIKDLLNLLIEFVSLVLYPQFESYVVHEEKFGLRLELEAKLAQSEVAAAA